MAFTMKDEKNQQEGLLNSIDSDFDSEAGDFKSSDNRKTWTAIQFKRFLPWILHLSLISLYTTIIFTNNHHSPPKRFPTELDSVEKYIKYEEVVFQASAFHPKGKNVNEYEGPPTPERNALWTKLWKSVGMIGITEEENNKLAIPAVQSRTHPDQYVVTIALFHQLHCIDRLRIVAWGNPNPTDETERTARKHTDHCIDYLRQAILCHGDVTPMPMVAATDMYGKLFYDTNWNVAHTCRNSDLLFEWATVYNNSGLVI